MLCSSGNLNLNLYKFTQVESYLIATNLPLKALLLLDNAPSHPPADELIHNTVDGKIWAMYMPPNVTPLIQPMDQNAIRLTKLFYRNNLLLRILASKPKVLNINTALKDLKLIDAVALILEAWNKVSSDSLRKC